MINQAFFEPGTLADGELSLVVMKLAPADPVRAFVPEYKFEMRRTGTPERLGSIRFRLSDEERFNRYFGQIGYDVDSPHRGHRYAARSVRLLLPLARLHGFRELWLSCDPDNVASRKSLEIAGGVYVETVAVPEDNPMYKEGSRELCRYRFEL